MKLPKFLKSSYATLALFLLQIQTGFADVLPSICDPATYIPPNPNSKIPGLLKNAPVRCDTITDPRYFNPFSSLYLNSEMQIYLANIIILGIILEFPIYHFLGSKSQKTTPLVLWMSLIKVIGFTGLLLLAFYIDHHSYNFQPGLQGVFQYFLLIPFGVAIISGIFFKLFVKQISWARAILVSLLANVASIGTATLIMISIVK